MDKILLRLERVRDDKHNKNLALFLLDDGADDIKKDRERMRKAQKNMRQALGLNTRRHFKGAV